MSKRWCKLIVALAALGIAAGWVVTPSVSARTVFVVGISSHLDKDGITYTLDTIKMIMAYVSRPGDKLWIIDISRVKKRKVPVVEVALINIPKTAKTPDDRIEATHFAYNSKIKPYFMKARKNAYQKRVKLGTDSRIRVQKALYFVKKAKRSPASRRVLVLLGSPFVSSKKLRNWGRCWPSDGFLRNPDSPFNTLGAGEPLEGWEVHWFFPAGSPFGDPVVQSRKVQRFWELWTRRLGGRLVTFTALAATQDYLDEDKVKPMYSVDQNAKITPNDTRMFRDCGKRPPPPPQTGPVVIELGGWNSRRSDFDLTVSVKGVSLNYQNRQTTFGTFSQKGLLRYERVELNRLYPKAIITIKHVGRSRLSGFFWIRITSPAFKGRVYQKMVTTTKGGGYFRRGGIVSFPLGELVRRK